MGSDVMFPIALTQAQFRARCFEGSQCGSAAGRAGFRTQRQLMPRAEVVGECRFPCLCQGFKFRTTSRLQRSCPARVPVNFSGHVVRLLDHRDSLPGVRSVAEARDSLGAGMAILNDSRKVARHPTYKAKYALREKTDGTSGLNSTAIPRNAMVQPYLLPRVACSIATIAPAQTTKPATSVRLSEDLHRTANASSAAIANHFIFRVATNPSKVQSSQLLRLDRGTDSDRPAAGSGS